jgi:hypothetical protein
MTDVLAPSRPLTFTQSKVCIGGLTHKFGCLGRVLFLLCKKVSRYPCKGAKNIEVRIFYASFSWHTFSKLAVGCKLIFTEKKCSIKEETHGTEQE